MMVEDCLSLAIEALFICSAFGYSLSLWQRLLLGSYDMTLEADTRT